MTKVATKQVIKRIDKVQKDLDAQYDVAFGKIHKVLSDLGFGAEYAERAATDIAEDYLNGLVEGTPPEIPIWHESDPDDEEEEDDEVVGEGDEDEEEVDEEVDEDE
jgi:hypothetical protein